MKNILVIGSFMTDLVFKTERIPVEGETSIGSSYNKFTGGKGANQAVAAARLNGNVKMMGKLGNDDFGKEHIASLQAEGIGHQAVLFDPEASTGVGNVTIDQNGNNRIIVVPGANMKLSIKDIDRFEDVIMQSNIVVLQLEIPIETVYRAIELAHKHNKTIILNPAPAQEIDSDMANKVDYFIPNETEASILTNTEVNNLDDAKEASKILLNQGYKNVILTLGDKGVLFRNTSELNYLEAFKMKAIDTTAAGDSFIGSFAYGLANNWNVTKAIKLAIAASAITVTRLGAQPSLPTLQEINELMKQPIHA
ncbi:ribokinase [Virgibacillus ndiopensis]|uniref:ribokinase n=1 Tax=Virgibacillus ndiopensis TaxID=2004408 RepID=UPI000C06DD18|nr:ribokinase [Virgibacillus ndiopensis]